MKKSFLIFFVLLFGFSTTANAEEVLKKYKIVKEFSKPKSNVAEVKQEKVEEITKGPEEKDEKITQINYEELFKKAQGFYEKSRAWKKLKCTPKTGFVCEKWSCKEKPTNSYLILDKKKEQITRCEDEFCETIDAEFEQTGIYYNIQSKGPVGLLIRVLGDSRYKEIVTIALDAYIGNGECTEI